MKRKHRSFFCIVTVLLFCAVISMSLLRPVRAEENGQELRLVAGNKIAEDRDAFVFVILGDGFARTEQDLFFTKAEETAEYLLETAPFKENRELFKIYALSCISEESGARGDQAQSKQEEIEDSRDTMFHSRYWTEGVQRLLSLDEPEEKKALVMASQYVEDMDFAIVLVNAQTYGGSGGDVCVASLHEKSMEIVLHELGHTLAGLGDEYWPGSAQMTETPNTTRQSDLALVPWADLMDREGIGVYPFADGGTGWYKPSEKCKMQYLGREYGFCAVCSRELTRAFAMHSDAAAIRNRRIFARLLVAAVGAVILFCLIIVVFQRKKHKKGN